MKQSLILLASAVLLVAPQCLAQKPPDEDVLRRVGCRRCTGIPPLSLIRRAEYDIGLPNDREKPPLGKVIAETSGADTRVRVNATGIEDGPYTLLLCAPDGTVRATRDATVKGGKLDESVTTKFDDALSVVVVKRLGREKSSVDLWNDRLKSISAKEVTLATAAPRN